MFAKTIILLLLTFTLVNSTSYKGKNPDCSKITCGRDCQGSCGWSSFYNKCKYGFTTSKQELNKGAGCKTKSNDDSQDGCKMSLWMALRIYGLILLQKHQSLILLQLQLHYLVLKSQRTQVR